MKRINEIYVYVNDDKKNEREGICAFVVNNYFCPMISTGNDESILNKMKEDARKFSKDKKTIVRLLKFTSPEIIEEINEGNE